MTGFPLTTPKPQFFDQNGNPLAGGTLEVYLAGTSTPTNLYSDAVLTIPAGTVITLNSRGEPPTPLFGSYAVAYKLILKDPAGAIIYTLDGYRWLDVDPYQANFPVTTRETSAGVTPTALGFPAGDVRRYGASATASPAVNRAAIQAALDCNNTVFLFDTFPVDATLYMHDGNFIIGAGPETGLYADSVTGFDLIAGKSVTPSAGTNVRRYDGGGCDFALSGGSYTGTRRLLNMSGCSRFKWYDIGGNGGDVGVLHAAGYHSVDNEFHGCDLSGNAEGIRNGTGAVGIRVFGGNLRETTSAAAVDDGSTDCQYHGVHVDELYDHGFKVGETAATNGTTIVAPIITTTHGGTTVGIQVYANATGASIITPSYSGLTTDLDNAGAASNLVLHSPITPGVSVDISGITPATPSIDFTGIPSWVNRVTLLLKGVSTSGTSRACVQIGAGSVTTTGYVAGAATTGSGSNATGSSGGVTTAIPIDGYAPSAATIRSGHVTFARITGNTWVASGIKSLGDGQISYFGGHVSLSGALDRIRLTTLGGADTFDAGVVNIILE
jgi:hypothetical protein